MDSATNKAIEQILEARFGKTAAQALKFGRARVVKRDLQYMDVKLMSEILERYRYLVVETIRGCRRARTAATVETDEIARLYLLMDVRHMEKRVDSAVKLWRMAHLDYHAMRKAYLIKCLGPKVALDWQKAA